MRQHIQGRAVATWVVVDLGQRPQRVGNVARCELRPPLHCGVGASREQRQDGKACIFFPFFPLGRRACVQCGMGRRAFFPPLSLWEGVHVCSAQNAVLRCSWLCNNEAYISSQSATVASHAGPAHAHSRISCLSRKNSGACTIWACRLGAPRRLASLCMAVARHTVSNHWCSCSSSNVGERGGLVEASQGRGCHGRWHGRAGKQHAPFGPHLTSAQPHNPAQHSAAQHQHSCTTRSARHGTA